MSDSERVPTRVLLVQEEEELRRFAEGLLAREGFAPLAYSSGKEALELLQREPFDLVLLDLDVKGEPDGLAICRELKGNPRLAWMPVMFLTGTAASEAISKVFEAGADEFLVKPFKPDELTVRAKVLVRKGREERWLVERARKRASSAPAGTAHGHIIILSFPGPSCQYKGRVQRQEPMGSARRERSCAGLGCGRGLSTFSFAL